MSKAALKDYKRNVADRLRSVGDFLLKEKIIKDKTPFEAAHTQCKTGLVPIIKGVKIDYAKCWGYELHNVLFTVKKDEIEGLLPNGAVLDAISVSSTVIGYVCTNDYAMDPLAHLEFNVVIKGKDELGNDMIACWHLDRHLEGGSSEQGQPDDVHPIYHFHYGGKNLALPDDKFQYGSHLVLEAPRLMHLPLDGVLGIDFVLSNFYGKKRKIYAEIPQYKNHIISAQDELWRPYVYSLATNWSPYTPSTCGSWSASKICPQLLKH